MIDCHISEGDESVLGFIKANVGSWEEEGAIQIVVLCPRKTGKTEAAKSICVGKYRILDEPSLSKIPSYPFIAVITPDEKSRVRLSNFLLSEGSKMVTWKNSSSLCSDCKQMPTTIERINCTHKRVPSSME